MKTVVRVTLLFHFCFKFQVLFVCVPACHYVHRMHAAPTEQKRVLNPLELVLEVAVSLPVWVLGTEPGSSPGVASVLGY